MDIENVSKADVCILTAEDFDVSLLPSAIKKRPIKFITWDSSNYFPMLFLCIFYDKHRSGQI